MFVDSSIDWTNWRVKPLICLVGLLLAVVVYVTGEISQVSPSGVSRVPGLSCWEFA